MINSKQHLIRRLRQIGLFAMLIRVANILPQNAHKTHSFFKKDLIYKKSFSLCFL